MRPCDRGPLLSSLACDMWHKQLKCGVIYSSLLMTAPGRLGLCLEQAMIYLNLIHDPEIQNRMGIAYYPTVMIAK